MPLTDAAIKNAQSAEKTRRLFDGGGLYLEISSSGGKWWRFKYRFPREKRISLGVYPEVSLKEAREKREAARKLLAAGIDPSENRKAHKTARVDRAANSFEVVAREWLNKMASTWVDSYSSRVIARLEQDIFPRLGARPISEITPPELLAVLRLVENREALETAHRLHYEMRPNLPVRNCYIKMQCRHLTGSSRCTFATREGPFGGCDQTRPDRANPTCH